ncbi:hypothetical protein ABTZ03_37990 [Kitasatospora sp. NPDC096077]|uniref:hypothetical protein n=1 Tax=Kitasatospora sp. NPDC096077 TaxID=3155544 RepID=UPI00332B2BC7
MADTATQEAFATVKKCVGLCGVGNAVALATVAVLAAAGHGTPSFVWIRAAILVALTPLLVRLTTRAADGDRQAFQRVRRFATVMPIAVIGVDLLPGESPVWFAAVEGLAALPLVAVAVLTRRAPLATAFPGWA